MAKTNINYSEVIKKFKDQRRSIGLIHFKLKEDANFIKWHSLTENLVIKVFGQKSNQSSQLHSLYYKVKSKTDYSFDAPNRMETAEIKEKFKNLLTVFIEELEIDIEPKINSNLKSRGNISSKNILIANQSMNVVVSIDQIINFIKENEPNVERAKEAEEKLKELDNELKQKSPTWAKIKVILEWLLNFSRDAFLAVLPIILESYKKQ